MACASWLMDLGFAGGAAAAPATVSERFLLKGTDDRYQELMGSDNRFFVLKGADDSYLAVDGS